MVVIQHAVVRHRRLHVLHIVLLIIEQLYMDVFVILFAVVRLIVLVIKYVFVIEYVVVNIFVPVKTTILQVVHVILNVPVINNVLVSLEMKLELLQLVLVINNVLARQTKLELQQHVLVIDSVPVRQVMKIELQQLVAVINSVLAILVILPIVVVVINNAHVRPAIVVVRVIVLAYLYVLGIAELMKQILNKINY